MPKSNDLLRSINSEFRKFSHIETKNITFKNHVKYVINSIQGILSYTEYRMQKWKHQVPNLLYFISS